MHDFTKDGEKEIFSYKTGLAVGDEFFCQKQHMTKEDLIPLMHSLADECDGVIKEPGIYAVKIIIKKIK